MIGWIINVIIYLLKLINVWFRGVTFDVVVGDDEDLVKYACLSAYCSPLTEKISKFCCINKIMPKYFLPPLPATAQAVISPKFISQKIWPYFM